jgi:Rrf2 family protein
MFEIALGTPNTTSSMLSKKCQYALHALIHLARLDEGQSTTINEIATARNIPKKFLETILLDLRNAGMLASRKGKSGGYYLLKKAAQIQVIEVVRLIDGAVAMLPCVSLNYYSSCGMCDDEKNCSINRIFGQVRDETLKILTSNTVADMAKKPGGILKQIVAKK